MGFPSSSSVVNFGYGENDLKNEVCPLKWSPEEKGWQLLNGGLKTSISRSTSVSDQRSQWADLSRKQTGARGKGWSGL